MRDEDFPVVTHPRQSSFLRLVVLGLHKDPPVVTHPRQSSFLRLVVLGLKQRTHRW
mgnify:CR=1 FL=1